MMQPIVEGTSEPYDVQLYDDGEPFVGTGFFITLVIVHSSGAVVGSFDALPPVAAWLSQADGTVRITGTETLTVGEYAVRFRVTDALETVGYFPREGAVGAVWETWEVVSVTP